MFKSRVFTLYPDYFPGYLEKGLFGKAMKEKIWSLEIVDIRNYAEDKHKTVDDTPYGGGDGMIALVIIPSPPPYGVSSTVLCLSSA